MSNRDELNEFISKNRIQLNIKQEINYRKNLTRSEKPSDRKNNFLNFDEKEKEKQIFSDCQNSKKNIHKENIKNKKNSIMNIIIKKYTKKKHI